MVSTVGTVAPVSSLLASPANSVLVLPSAAAPTNGNGSSDSVNYGGTNANAQGLRLMPREDGGQSIPLWENDQSTLAAQASTKQQMSSVLKATLLVNSAMLLVFSLIIANQFRDRKYLRNAEDIFDTAANLERAGKSQYSVSTKVNAEVSQADDNRSKAALAERLNRIEAALNSPSGQIASLPPFASPTTRGPIDAGRTVDGGIIKASKGAGVLIIDHAPPAQLGKAQLAYFFKDGLLAAPMGESALDYSTTMMRQRILDSHTRVSDPAHYPAAWKSIVNSDQNPTKTLLEHFYATPEAIKNQGFKDTLPDTYPKHTWNQMCDWSKGYIHALSHISWKRKVGAAKTLPKQYFGGMRKAQNNPSEIGYKGGRTLFTSLPATLVVGMLVASMAVAMTEMRSQKSSNN